MIPPRLEEGRAAILAISDRVERVQTLHKVASEDYKSVLKFGLIEVVYEWAKGMVSAMDICQSSYSKPSFSAV